MSAMTIEIINNQIQGDLVTHKETTKETFDRYQGYINELNTELRSNFNENKYNQFVAYKSYVAELKNQIKEQK